MSVFSFHPGDPTFNQAVSSGWKVRNMAGSAGSYAAGLLTDLFGLGAVLVPLVLTYLGLSRFISHWQLRWWRWCGLVGLCVGFIAMVNHPWFHAVDADAHGLEGGGYLGALIFRSTMSYLHPAGAFLLWFFIALASLQLLAALSWEAMAKTLRDLLVAGWLRLRESVARRLAERAARPAEPEKPKRTKRLKVPKRKAKPVASDPESEDGFDAVLKPFAEGPATGAAKGKGSGAAAKTGASSGAEGAPKGKSPAARPAKSGGMPQLDFLDQPPTTAQATDPKALQALADRLVECLADFNVQGEVQHIMPGPVVTMFEFKPAPGVKVSKIAGLVDDIALALKATALRIEAPIPGKDSVGIEIPNEKREVVYLSEILGSDAFIKAKSPLTLALGKDIEGTPRVADLAKMPHLLVAGATGAGKSVCLNGILLSMLYKADPDQVRLLLVDPKRIELAVYADLPHLVHPVVTDMGMAKSALDWAVHEMDRRYESMARLGVRNIEGYNVKLAAFGDEIPEDFHGLEPLPFIVIVIDELADLMMTAGKEAEVNIVRLAQLARACGIHLILATQRPSVDVVTGLIKANFPTRISFQTTSKHDSRTILDTVGAEKLLGRGDMLFKPSGSKMQRMHGAFVDEEEIGKVVKFWKDARPQRFELDFNEWGREAEASVTEGVAGGMDNDPIYNEAVDFVLEQGKASISLIQRRFRIGFNRAARYIEQMEIDGMLGPQEGSKPRAVIKSRD